MKLGDYITLVGGGTPSKKIEEYWNGDIPWATVKDIKNDFLYQTQDTITRKGLENSASKIIDKDKIVIATRMAVGKVIITQMDVAINQDLKGITCSDTIDSRYLFYFLRSKESYFLRVASGATVKGIKINHITDIDIDLPSIEVQKKVVTLLDAASELKQKDNALIAKYNELSQSLFLDMFGDPANNSMGWDILPLQKLLSSKTQNGLYVPKDQYSDSGVEMVHMANAFYGIVETGNLKKVLIPEKDIEKYNLDKHDLLLARRSLNYEGAAKPCRIPCLKTNLVYESSLIRIRPNLDKILTIYLYHYLNSERVRNEYVYKHVTRSTISGINNKGLNAVKVLVPPIDLQNKFEEHIQSIEQQKQKAQASLKKSEELFNCLLQKVFKGELVA